MAFVLWEEKYRVGIKSIDDQHKQLFDLINKLHEAMVKGKDKKIIGETFCELAECTASHFSDEEENMKLHAYPGYDEHKKEHDSLAKEIAEVLKNFSGGKTQLSTSIMFFLKDWLYKHILKMDLLYVDYLIDKGVVPPQVRPKKR